MRTSCDDPVDDGIVVFAGLMNDAEKFARVYVVGPEEVSVPAAAKHGVGWKFASKLGSGLGDDAREPANTLDFVRLGG